MLEEYEPNQILQSLFLFVFVDIGPAAWDGRQLLAEVDGQAH